MDLTSAYHRFALENVLKDPRFWADIGDGIVIVVLLMLFSMIYTLLV